MAESTLEKSPQDLFSRLDEMVAAIEKRLSTKWPIEIGIVALVSILIAIIFGRYARGGANSSDITMYLNLGINGIKMPFVLNRYFHVFLQHIFVGLAPQPMVGYHYFWGFLVGLNTFMVYITARKVRQSNTFLHAILAVMVFFGMSVLGDVSGVIVVDLTAMTLLMAVFMVYVLSMHHAHTKPWLVGTIGFTLYLAFKTKETTLPVAVVLLGLGWMSTARFNWRSMLKNLLWVACGVAAGIVFFAALSWIILGDPFFGLRISEWVEFRNTYAVYSSRVLDTLNAMGDGNIDDWYQGYWFEITLLPFLLYLISGIKGSRDSYMPRKLLYLVPLAFVVFMLISINNRLGYELRFGLPILPVLSVLSVQFIDLSPPQGAGERVKYWGILAGGLVLAFAVRLVLRLIVPGMNWDLGAVILLVYYPLLLTVLFVSLVLFDNNPYWHLVNFLIVFSLVISPIASNYRAMFVVRDNEARFNEVIKPLIDFEADIEFTPEMHFYTTSSTFTRAELRMVKDQIELMVLFNVLFNASSTAENFTYAQDPTDIPGDITAQPYDFVLMTDSEWEAITGSDETELAVLDRYQPKMSPDSGFVLLIPLD
jgi:hypothetical protein